MKRPKAWDEFSKYIRLRDADLNGNCACITCGHVYHWSKMDAGHFIAWHAGNETKFDETNVHAQCKRCNVFGSGEQYLYSLAIAKRYGKDHPTKLFLKSKRTTKLFPFELTELQKHFKKEWQKIKKQKKL